MKNIVLIVTVLFFLASCASKPVTPVSKEDWLRNGGKWKISNFTKHSKRYGKVYPYKDTIVNVLKYMPNCLLDDYLTFSNNYKASRYYGNNTCLPGDPALTDLTWGFTNGYKNLHLYGNIGDWLYPIDTNNHLNNNSNLFTVNATVSYINPAVFIIVYDAYFPLTDTIGFTAAGYNHLNAYTDTTTYTCTFTNL
jgi:hypothetical protein